VRRVQAQGDAALGLGQSVDYAVVAGAQAGQSGSCSVEEFRAWARFGVRLQDTGRWVKQ